MSSLSRSRRALASSVSPAAHHRRSRIASTRSSGFRARSVMLVSAPIKGRCISQPLRAASSVTRSRTTRIHASPATRRQARSKSSRTRARISCSITSSTCPRRRGDCVRCHVGISEGDTHLLPPMATCFRCHDHDAARDARTCDACHRGLDNTTMLPQSHLAHDGDWMREHGTKAASSGDSCQSCHRESFCAECHAKTAVVIPATAHFENPFTPSVHRAGFEARHALEARSDPGACTTCHQPERCIACHTANGVAGTNQRSPHPSGWVGLSVNDNAHGRAARRDPASCASCHDGAGQALCVSCHKVGGVGGSPHPAGWSSRVPLASLPCRLCHTIGSRP